MTNGVSIYFVDVYGRGTDPIFSACGSAELAGPFMSAGSAADWRDEFCEGAEVQHKFSNDPGVCTDGPLIKDENGWHRF